MMIEVPPREIAAPVKIWKIIGKTAITPRNIAPTIAIFQMTLEMKSEVGLPGRMPGIAPLFLRRLFAISTGLRCV